MSEMSQATILGKRPPKTWQDLSEDCCIVFGGGHRSDEKHLEIFRHGMRTAFNLLDGEMPTLAEVRAIPALVKAVKATKDWLDCHFSMGTKAPKHDAIELGLMLDAALAMLPKGEADG